MNDEKRIAKFNNLASSTKSAFTRAYNNAFKDSIVQKKKKKTKEANEEDMLGGDSQDEGIEENEEGSDYEVKGKEGKPKKGKATGGAKKTGAAKGKKGKGKKGKQESEDEF